MIFGHNRLVAAIGLEDVIVVDTPDAVLAADRNRAEDVRELVEQLKAEGRPEREYHRRVPRPWGWYEVIDSGDRFQVKRTHGQSRSGAVATDAPSPVRALGSR